MRPAPGAVLIMVLASVVASCTSANPVDIDNPWSRTSPMVDGAGAVYMELTSANGDLLIGASVDSSIAAVVEIHETVMVEMGSDDTVSGAEGMGAMTMQEVGSIALLAGKTVRLEPGGYHLMLFDLAAPLELGQRFDLTVQFEDAGDVVVEVEVREEAP